MTAQLNEARSEPLGMQNVDALSTPILMARVLSGFLDPSSAGDELALLPPQSDEIRQRISEQFGRAATLPNYPRAGKPYFSRVKEESILALLKEIVPQLPDANLSNLQSFEWVEIEPLIAGHLRSEPILIPRYHPDPTDLTAVARFTFYPFKDTLRLEATPNGTFLLKTPGPCVIAPKQIQFSPAGLMLVYGVAWQPQPIRVLVIESRAIAISGLSRLATLYSLGVRRALCSVFYGYGAEVIDIVPSTPSPLLESARPPLVTDFLNPVVSTEVMLRSKSVAYEFRVSESVCD